ncbi:MAG TPA: hypothetical protein DGA22_11225 [Acidobacterium sp.]|nr:hypothetical protein [Acidobacterium sp.]
MPRGYAWLDLRTIEKMVRRALLRGGASLMVGASIQEILCLGATLVLLPRLQKINRVGGGRKGTKENTALRRSAAKADVCARLF